MSSPSLSEPGVTAALTMGDNFVERLFFHILQHDHFYLLCVDFVSERLEIIDNSASTHPIDVKYGDTPENMKLLLLEYFKFVGERLKSAVCANLKTKRMSMKWRDTKSKVDLWRVSYAAHGKLYG
nr:ulp1 protease family, C-terminal catalytic domain-containing protein [Ipomoea batatas]